MFWTQTFRKTEHVIQWTSLKTVRTREVVEDSARDSATTNHSEQQRDEKYAPRLLTLFFHFQRHRFSGSLPH